MRASTVLLISILCWIGSPTTRVAATAVSYFDCKLPPHDHRTPLQTTWIYTGQLIDPLTGQFICNVQGLELLHEMGRSDHNLESFERRCRSLQVLRDLPASSACSVTSVLSRKLFCYCDETNQNLLESFRSGRPGAPSRTVPMSQSFVVSDAVTSLVEWNNNNKKKQPSVLHAEFPNGKTVWGTIQASASDDANNQKEFTVFASTKDFVPHRLIEPDPPRRSAWVQFGNGPTQVAFQNTRETYRFMNGNDNNDHLRYTRYGEGPVWYGPGKLCQLQLQGKRVSGLVEAARHVPVVTQTARRLNRKLHCPYIMETQSLSSKETDNDDDKYAAATTPPGVDDPQSYHRDLQYARMLDRFRASSTLLKLPINSVWERVQLVWDRLRVASTCSSSVTE